MEKQASASTQRHLSGNDKQLLYSLSRLSYDRIVHNVTTLSLFNASTAWCAGRTRQVHVFDSPEISPTYITSALLLGFRFAATADLGLTLFKESD
jgi:hypothetical protein